MLIVVDVASRRNNKICSFIESSMAFFLARVIGPLKMSPSSASSSASTVDIGGLEGLKHIYGIKGTWNSTQKKKRKQAYNDEEVAVKAYDLAALKY
ncbi:hypothetical protein Fmac_005785 [Flemingia macrophylla]|uniref:AP2/ERF domain-containing protein n=1 Tax=Flemingia macrophylla TaxID=520843 RepID=A0ABD1N8U9_9FABA